MDPHSRTINTKEINARRIDSTTYSAVLKSGSKATETEPLTAVCPNKYCTYIAFNEEKMSGNALNLSFRTYVNTHKSS